MNAVIIPAQSPLPALEVVPLVMVTAITGHVSSANDIIAVNSSNVERANMVVLALHNDSKALTTHVESLKKPLNQLLKAVRECADNAEAPLLAAKRDLQAKIGIFNAAEAKRLAEQRRIAEEQAAKEREAAQKERIRLQAIADAEHAEKVAQAQKQAEEDAKLVADLLGGTVEVKEVVVEPAPIIKAAPVVIAPIIEAIKPSAVTMRKTKVLIISDAKLIPITVGGVEIRPVDETKLKALLLAGVSVPGACIEEREVSVMARGT